MRTVGEGKSTTRFERRRFSLYSLSDDDGQQRRCVARTYTLFHAASCDSTLCAFQAPGVWRTMFFRFNSKEEIGRTHFRPCFISSSLAHSGPADMDVLFQAMAGIQETKGLIARLWLWGFRNRSRGCQPGQAPTYRLVNANKHAPPGALLYPELTWPFLKTEVLSSWGKCLFIINVIRCNGNVHWNGMSEVLFRVLGTKQLSTIVCGY